MRMKCDVRTWRAAAAACCGVVALAMASMTVAAQSASTVAKSAKVHDGVYEIVVSPTSGNVYVAAIGKRGENTGTVLTLDPVTLEVKNRVDVSTQPAFGLAINDKTQTLYSSNTRTGSVSAIDLKTGKTLAVISDPNEPKAHTFKVLVDEVNDKVYVSIANKVSRIWVIDGKTNTLEHVMQETGVTTVGMAIDPNTGKLYAANLGANEIIEIDPKTRQITKRFPAGGERPTQMVIDGNTSRLFVTNQASGDVSVLDVRTGNLIRTVKTGAGALGIGFNPTNNRVYVANRQAGTVTVVNAETYAVEANLTAGSLPNTVAVNPKTNSTYVTNKAKGGPRDAPPVEDPGGDTVTLITSK